MNLCINGEMAYEYKRNPYYFITKSGRVYSIYKVGGQGSVDASYPHELRYGFDRDGYKRVVLSLYGHKRYVKVHTLVAEQFIGDVVSPYTVNHIDGNKTNNDVTNLEIVTGADNTRHAHTTGLTTREVQVRVEHDGVVKTYRSIIESRTARTRSRRAPITARSKSTARTPPSIPCRRLSCRMMTSRMTQM